MAVTTIYEKGLQKLLKAGDWESVVIRVALLRSTSTYTPDPDHEFVDDVIGGGPGGVEISVASYTRKTLGSAAVTIDTSGNSVFLDAANVNWATLESGQTVLGYLYYIQVGGDDTTPEDDELLLFYNGRYPITLAVDASASATSIQVDPLKFNIPDEAALDFGGGATCAMDAAATAGDRILTVTALADAATAGDTSEVKVDTILPVVLTGGAFDITFSALGLIKIPVAA